MNCFKIYFLEAIIILGLTGCATTLNLHTDKTQLRDNISVLSPVGIYHDRATFTSILLTSIDGVSVGEFVREVTLDAGKYMIKYQASNNSRICNGTNGGLAVCFNQTIGEMEVILRAGHTYIPNVIFNEKTVDVFMVDKGINFPQRCLPRNMEISGEKNPNKCDLRPRPN